MRVQPLVNNIIVAYTYLLTHKITKQYYYGVRYCGICESYTPYDDLWIKYFSSSNEVENLINLHGADSFKYEIRQTFTTVDSAIAYEHKVLRRLNVINKSNWLNKSDNKAIDRASSQKGAERAHKIQKENDTCISKQSEKGNRIKKEKIRSGECTHGGKPVGFKDSAATRKKKSLAQSGSKNSGAGKKWIKSITDLKSKRIHPNDPIPEGWTAGKHDTKKTNKI